ncbi:glycosyltransferase family 25 protein [Acidocella aromatica]|uniref:Glycosyl transferase family 25 n=1 Tax=Acidocella aromatica TaxID=1303579 RepID=A0A840V8G4_9PROT|nr:glycosyltransferase family 25 protein [Acidocella aromatica]MBB5372003.1 glycosyl transferase family 25 [Acidocella aromatica]
MYTPALAGALARPAFGGPDSADEAVLTPAAIPIYVISLDRVPERREHMRAQMARLGLAHEIVQAVDGREPIEGLERIYDRSRRLRTYGSDLTLAEIACCLSHLEVCRRIAASEAGIGLVLEDDVVLSDTVAPVLAELAGMRRGSFEVVRLAGLRERRGRIVRRLSGGYDLARLAVGPCGAQAYVVTAAGARKLISYCTPITQQIDIALDETCFNRLDTYAVLPYPVRHETGIASTIGERAADDARRGPAGLYQIARRTLLRNFGAVHGLLRMYLA